MKLLMFFAPSFWYRPFEKTLPDAPEAEGEYTVRQAVVVFYQVEAADEDNRAKVLTKALKNVKWLARKFDTPRVVLHSFNHLSSSKARPEFARALADDLARRLGDGGLDAVQTPFGYLNEWDMHVAGESLAKVFKEF